MKTGWRTFRAVLRYELRQGWRSPLWWLLALNFALPAVLISPSPSMPWVILPAQLLSPLETILPAGLLLFLAWVPLLERESRGEGYAMFWTRSGPGGWVWLGKVAAGLVLTALALLPAVLYVLAVSVPRYGALALRYAGTGLVLFGVPALAVFVALTLLLHLLVPQPALRRALAVGLGLAIVFTHDLQDTTRLLAPIGHFPFSSVTGFAPFQRLLLWQRLTWILLSGGAALLVVAALVRRLPRVVDAAERRWSRVAAGVGVALLLASAAAGALFHTTQARRFVPAAPIPAAAPLAAACPPHYQLDVTFDLRALRLHGMATAQGEWPAPRLHDGLAVTDRQPGSLTYGGSPRWQKTLFWCPVCLRDAALIQQRRFAAYGQGWLWVEGHLFLLPHGDWHPYPGCPVEHLTVRLQGLPCPNGECLAHSADEANAQAGDWRLVWSRGAPAGPLVVLGRAYRPWEVGERRFLVPHFLYSPAEQEEVVGAWALVLERMAQVGLDGDAVRTVAVADLLRYPRWGEGVLLAPVGMVTARSRARNEEAYRHASALYALLGWWCADQGDACLQALPEVLARATKEARLPAGVPNNPDALAQALTQQKGTATAMTLLSLWDYAAFRLHAPQAPWDMAVSGGDVLSGTVGTGRSVRSVQYLDALYRQDPAVFWQIVRAYRQQYGLQDIPLVDFAAWVQAQWGLPGLPAP